MKIKKIFIVSFLTILSFAIMLQPVQASTFMQDDEVAHLLAGSFLEEHLKNKDCDPILRFGIITGLSVIKELVSNNFELKNIQFTVIGIGFSFTAHEIFNFIDENIVLKQEE